MREALALSEEEVAEAMGVTRATVRSWETGRSAPRGRKREAYARLLGTPGPTDPVRPGAEAPADPRAQAQEHSQQPQPQPQAQAQAQPQAQAQAQPQ
ncbi:helix-turn-helix transcriptional regulator, partial [Streptomyces litmocidini]|uniref:helix-turn-helix transcriptional regulator n=1 Tax=Streptomyces litmocidini TaxID=67318 RepID=UPI003570D220